jgi:hypothetical protein
MSRLMRLAIFAAAVISLSAGTFLLTRDHPLWWSLLLSAVSVTGWILLERFAAATMKMRARPDAYDLRRVKEEWLLMWRRMLLLPPLLAVTFLMFDVQRSLDGAPFFDFSSGRAFLETVGFPVLLPLALFLYFLSIRDLDPTRHSR